MVDGTAHPNSRLSFVTVTDGTSNTPGLSFWSGFSVGQASSLSSIEENSLFLSNNDKLEAYPTIKTTIPELDGVTKLNPGQSHE